MDLHRPLIIASLCLFSCACSAGGPSESAPADHAASATSARSSASNGTEMASIKSAAASPSAGSADSLCGPQDQVVFSCPLAKGNKIASMCAAKGTGGAEPTFYYAFGPAGAPELRFPASDKADNAAFNRTHLGFAGNTGGYAYSFANAGYKYIVYSVSGERASHDGGVIVQPSDTSKAATRLACRSGAITETSNDALIDATLRLKKDPQIQSGGLPEIK